MTALAPGKTVSSKSPTITVDAGLAAGTHVIQLVVVDNSGNASDPARLTVMVRARRVTGPGTTGVTPVLDPLLDPATVKEVVQPPTPVDPVIKATRTTLTAKIVTPK